MARTLGRWSELPSGLTDWTHVSEEAAADGQWAVSARLQVLEEILAVKVPQLLHVAKDDGALPPQVLRQVQALHLGEIVLDDIAEGADVLPLRGDHLVHDVLHFTGQQNEQEHWLQL